MCWDKVSSNTTLLKARLWCWMRRSSLSSVSHIRPPEGGSQTFAVTVTPQGTTNTLLGDVEWDLDGDGEFDDATGTILSLTWDTAR